MISTIDKGPAVTKRRLPGMRCLVTGASGFVGSHLVEHLLAEGDEVVGGIFGAGVPLSCPTVSLDVTDMNDCRRVLSEVQPDAIYHLAGIASPPSVSQNVAASLSVNVGGVHAVLSAAAELARPPQVLVVSSGEVYGKAGSLGVPISEETPPEPWNDYALSKVMAEEVAHLFQRRGDVPIVIARPFNHTGPGQSDSFVVSAFARQLAAIHADKQPPHVRVGNLAARRDFSDVRDIVRAYRLLVTCGAMGIFNVASGRSISIREVLDLLVLSSGLSIRVEQDPARMRPAEVPEIVGSFDKLHAATGWCPTIPIEDTIRSVYQWWVEVEGGSAGD